ncbi:hypothetical protein K443DRAFT_604501 [Laccaria amethystina LaAM-08-1]|uniref:Uncharacterized protein n=1 Tax=Laccaria amethystina LaAM-08-1 TaxID=1095629 RepID=A0A0C9YIR0_9AGAR|nr:hypothetical protein K443DRAFT_604501 [Laccaria amethystina LaAM-08-1]
MNARRSPITSYSLCSRHNTHLSQLASGVIAGGIGSTHHCEDAFKSLVASSCGVPSTFLIIKITQVTCYHLSDLNHTL